jgi:hypothetical protein
VAKARVESLSHKEYKYAGSAMHRRRAPGAASRSGGTQFESMEKDLLRVCVCVSTTMIGA